MEKKKLNSVLKVAGVVTLAFVISVGMYSIGKSEGYVKGQTVAKKEMAEKEKKAKTSLFEVTKFTINNDGEEAEFFNDFKLVEEKDNGLLTISMNDGSTLIKIKAIQRGGDK
jgi:hypothetical protein